MTKSETREVDKIKTFLLAGMTDTAARSLSALIRSTLSRKTSQELMQWAIESGLIFHPEFITGN